MFLISNYPIQVTANRNLIQSEEELLNFINQYNTKLTLYYSIYQCQLKTNSNTCCNIEQNNYHFCNTKIDKICFDIDNLNSLEIIKKFHFYCLKNNLKHLILFSGQKGFHIYIFTKNYDNIKNPKQSLLNSHNFLIKELNLKVNGNGNSDADSHILGDVSRLMRYPNTLHMESKLFCIPLITEDLILGKNHIMQKARKQNFLFTYYGTELLDMKQFDNGKTDCIVSKKNFIEKEKIEITIDKQKILETLPECLQDILIQPYVYWSDRFLVVRFLQHYLGYVSGEVDLVMKSFLEGKKHPVRGEDNYCHYLKERQNSYIHKNKSLFSCKKIKQLGYCKHNDKCKFMIENKLYY